jgi:hypothetical protein
VVAPFSLSAPGARCNALASRMEKTEGHREARQNLISAALLGLA